MRKSLILMLIGACSILAGAIGDQVSDPVKMECVASDQSPGTIDMVASTNYQADDFISVRVAAPLSNAIMKEEYAETLSFIPLVDNRWCRQSNLATNYKLTATRTQFQQAKGLVRRC